jgi:hypothetical protein
VSKADHKILRDKFLSWQCGVRQTAMREDGGRPSPGMCPRLLNEEGGVLADALTVLLVPKDPEESTAFFRFQAMKSPDPRETYEKALTYLQAEYFQDPKAFSDRLLATLPPETPLAKTLFATKRCVLVFAQGRYGFRLPCKVKALNVDDADRDAAIWHNRVFNPALTEMVHVAAFEPDWSAAQPVPGQETLRAKSL